MRRRVGGSTARTCSRARAAGPTADEAARFLTQATFGPTDADIARVQSIGYSAWIDEQFALPATPHLPYVQANFIAGANTANFNFMQDSFWQQAIPAPDQLRQRVKFALSRTCRRIRRRQHDRRATPMASRTMPTCSASTRSATTGKLLEAVATSPMMGIYLSHLGNKKAKRNTGAVPDENFARELMQLLTIGL